MKPGMDKAHVKTQVLTSRSDTRHRKQTNIHHRVLASLPRVCAPMPLITRRGGIGVDKELLRHTIDQVRARSRCMQPTHLAFHRRHAHRFDASFALRSVATTVPCATSHSQHRLGYFHYVTDTCRCAPAAVMCSPARHIITS